MPSPAPCDCPACPNQFSERVAEDALKRYRRNGPDSTTRTLIGAITAEGIDGATLLDIGGGIGAIQLELLAAGLSTAESVDASAPYIAVAEVEAARRGFGDRTRHRVGDFVALADDVGQADIVTLDRMICCYGDGVALIGRSAGHARRMIGLVYPRDQWWVRSVARLMNAGSRILRRPTRWHIHAETLVDGLLRDAGFERRLLPGSMLWRVALWVRPHPT